MNRKLFKWTFVKIFMTEKKISSLEDAIELHKRLNESKRDFLIVKASSSAKIGTLARQLGEYEKGSHIVYAQNDTALSPDSHKTYIIYIPLHNGLGTQYVVYTSVPQETINVA